METQKQGFQPLKIVFIIVQTHTEFCTQCLKITQNVAFEFFNLFFVGFKFDLSGNTDRKLKIDLFRHFFQNVNVARFARNVE